MLTAAERDELLIRLDERTENMHKALFGNGRPGVLSDVAVLQDEMRRREEEARDLRVAIPSKRRNALINSGLMTTVIVAILTAAKEVFGGG